MCILPYNVEGRNVGYLGGGQNIYTSPLYDTHCRFLDYSNQPISLTVAEGYGTEGAGLT